MAKNSTEKKDETAKAGDNSGASGDLINSFVQRIERLKDEQKALGEDVKDLYAEAKSRGLEVGIIKEIVRLRSKNQEKLKETLNLMDLYCSAAKIDLPLFSHVNANTAK